MDSILEKLLSYNPQKFALISSLVEAPQEPTKGLFVNRTLRMDDIDFIGFDMDYTLAIYKKVEIEELAFVHTIKKLINEKGYPKLVNSLKYDPRYVIRGLVIDKEKGNILKLDRHKHICRADHGTKTLSSKDIRLNYTNGKISQSNNNYISVDTLFSLPEAYMYAKMVDLFDKNKLSNVSSYAQLFDDIKFCIDRVHRDGSLKNDITKDLNKYIYKDPRLPLVLDRFRSEGKKLFVLTNSEWEYTNTVMNYLLENTMLEYKSWKDFFDLIWVTARKPLFFAKGSELEIVNDETGEHKSANGVLDISNIYSGGCYTDLEKMLEAKGEKVLYVGDHIYGDILRSYKTSNWRTVLVIEELEDELAKMNDVYYDMKSLGKLEEKRNKLDYEVALYKNKIKKLIHLEVENLINLSEEELKLVKESISEFQVELINLEQRLKDVVKQIIDLKKFIDSTFHEKWGPIFIEFDEISRFGDQVRDYAWIYTSRLSNLFFYPVNNYFKSLRDMMPHEKVSFK